MENTNDLSVPNILNLPSILKTSSASSISSTLSSSPRPPCFSSYKQAEFLDWQIENTYEILINTMDDWTGSQKFWGKKVKEQGSTLPTADFAQIMSLSCLQQHLEQFAPANCTCGAKE